MNAMAGLLAQPMVQPEALRALCFGVWQHGAAADALLASTPNYTIEDLAAVIGQICP